MEMSPLYLPAILFVGAIIMLAALLNRYRRCPSDKILVIFGTRGTNGSAKCIHGGGAFVWPIIQDYAYLSLTPISIEANLTNALSRQNIRVDVPCRFTVGISTEGDSMNNAAERLLGLKPTDIQEMARDILFGQLRLVIASMSIEELNSDRDKFQENIMKNVEIELKKIGLKLINVNVTDIKDESGYIEALGKEAAAKAINEAKVSVAEQDKIGEIGRAEAMKETRIRTSEANAMAIAGENKAKVEVANSDADRREREAEAQRRAVAAEKVAQAKALEEAYSAERLAETARAERERASQQANVIVAQEVEKRRIVIEAEAEAEQKRVQAKQAEGYDKMIRAAGGDANKAYMLLLLEKLPELVRTQVEAIKGINIDKVTVWDNGGQSADGKGSTANFVSGLLKSVPPLADLFDQAGMSLPEYLGKRNQSGENEAAEAEEV